MQSVDCISITFDFCVTSHAIFAPVYTVRLRTGAPNVNLWGIIENGSATPVRYKALSVDGACLSLATLVMPTPVKTILELFRHAFGVLPKTGDAEPR